MHHDIFVAALRGSSGPPKSLGIVAPASPATLVLVTFAAGTSTEERAFLFFLLSVDAWALANWSRFLRDRLSQTTQKQPFVWNRSCN